MKKLIILIPLYNDWQSASKLINDIDLQINDWSIEVSIVIINDASTEKRIGSEFNFKKIKSIKILNMKQNKVHQRCIAAGLKYICKNEEFDRVIVMDADGEDRPEELSIFLQKAKENPEKTITGNRFKRSEGLMFKILYEIHKVLTFVFTGKLIKFGNFTCLPKNHVEELIQKSYLWNSYSSSVVRAIGNRTFIPSIRGYRYVLPSKMKLTSLVFHSLTIISVFRKEVIFRSTLLFLVYFFFIFTNITLLSIFPIFCLFIFTLIIFKISKRANFAEFEKSLENISSIEVLKGSNSR